ncbi:MAG: TonB-dependent receptor [Cyanothece sp. SIO1E1]|nr:TonB-dependent receptor [Cyanothece sp. SIO1E1]
MGTQVNLRVDGRPVDASLIGRTETDTATNLITQTWYGVTLALGQNTIIANVVGSSQPAASVTVQVRGTPVQLQVEPVETRIPADGRSTATIQGQLLDANGNRSNWNAVVTLATSAGNFIGTDYDPDAPGFQIQALAGHFTATLQSGIKTQIVRIRAMAMELEAFSQIEFETALRSSGLVTGVLDFRLGARGTNFFDSFREFLPPDEDNRTVLDVSGAIFATTNVGKWLFTGAFNSDRSLNEDCNGESTLFRGNANCNQNNYPVVGDDATIDFVAPANGRLFLKLERTSPVEGAGSDYFLWGDFNTEEFSRSSQLFTATSRSLHGFKGNFNFGNLQITGLYGDNVEGFQRDTIAPDGTSGFYFLSRRLVIPGSEQIFLELQVLNRPGTVIEREQLTRGLDYEIDYDRGTLLFRRPILQTDINNEGLVSVRQIVATYQFESDDDTNIFAGRVQYNFSHDPNHPSWIGATYWRENMGDRSFELYGADALITFGKDGQLIAEYARSENDLGLGEAIKGSAFRVELEGSITDWLYGKAYLSSVDTGFSNDATSSFVPGQTRYGVSLDARLSPKTNFRVKFDHEDNVGFALRPLDVIDTPFDTVDSLLGVGQPGITANGRVDNSLTTLSAGIQQRIGKANLALDFVHRRRQDRVPPNSLERTSNQLRTRLTVPLADNLTLRAQNELALSSGDDPLFPSRTILGLDWQIHPSVNIGLNQVFFQGGQLAGRSITSLDISAKHQLGKDTLVYGDFSVITDQHFTGLIGIEQGWTIAPGLRADFTYERTFSTGFGATAAGPQFPQAVAVGQTGSSLGLTGGNSFSMGLAYTNNPDFQASARFEHQTSARGSNTVISANALGRISPALTALFRYHQASSANQTLNLGSTINLKLGLAYRDPNSDRFNALLRYEYRKNPATTPDTILFGSGTGSEEQVFSVEAIYAPNWRWEFFGKYAFRHSKSRLADDFISTSSVHLGQIRAVYRFGYNWDVAAEARWIGQPSAGFNETGFVAEIGYYLNPNLRLSAGYSFGSISDRDLNDSRSAGGFFLGVNVKLDNNFFRDFGFGDRGTPSQQRGARVKAEVREVREAGEIREAENK